MAAGKEIRNQIGSIKNTQKITSAMEMVAASKMRKAQDRMQLGKPYYNIRNVVSHIAASTPEYKHTYMEEREVKRMVSMYWCHQIEVCAAASILIYLKP